jgi:hypothetical protein
VIRGQQGDRFRLDVNNDLTDSMVEYCVFRPASIALMTLARSAGVVSTNWGDGTAFLRNVLSFWLVSLRVRRRRAGQHILGSFPTLYVIYMCHKLGRPLTPIRSSAVL